MTYSEIKSVIPEESWNTELEGFQQAVEKKPVSQGFAAMICGCAEICNPDEVDFSDAPENEKEFAEALQAGIKKQLKEWEEIRQAGQVPEPAAEEAAPPPVTVPEKNDIEQWRETAGALTFEELTSGETLQKVVGIKDSFTRQQVINVLKERARVLKKTAAFNQTWKAYQESVKAKEEPKMNHTHFTGAKPDLVCGDWIADNEGVRRPVQYNFISVMQWASRRPVTITEGFRNVLTGECFLTIKYKTHELQWQERTVPVSVLASDRKIIELSSYGLPVTSDNAKLLVKYLADLQELNAGAGYPVKASSNKLGWIQDGSFVPYCESISFEKASVFNSLASSVHECGVFSEWLQCMKELREKAPVCFRVVLAASFAAPLVHLINGLPFIVDLWGNTETGKSVSLMAAASVWADPFGARFIGDYQTTRTALEMRCAALNSLPCILDDSSKANQKLVNEMEPLIYSLCAGKGKSRSNKALGLNEENSWQNCIITCGERPLSSYAKQGGAYNRILEINVQKTIFQDPSRVINTIQSNYGHAGKLFIDKLLLLGFDRVWEMYNAFMKQLNQLPGKTDKQAASIAIILTADKIAGEIFQDDKELSLVNVVNILADASTVSDGKRAFEYLRDKIQMNPERFESIGLSTVERWGLRKDGCVCLYPTAMEQLLQAGGYSKDAFLTWAKNEDILICGSDRKRFTKKVRSGSGALWMYCLVTECPEPEQNEFQVDEEGISSQIFDAVPALVPTTFLSDQSSKS